jgi:hypothetical protein
VIYLTGKKKATAAWSVSVAIWQCRSLAERKRFSAWDLGR